MEIRHAEETDIVALVDLFRSSVIVQGKEHYSAEQVVAWANTATEESFDRLILRTTTFVALDGTTPLGFCGYAPDGHITSLYVRPESAGKGVGSALLEYVLEDARAHGIKAFRTEASHMAIPIFGKFGFTHAGKEDYMLGNVHFSRNLMTLQDEIPDA